MVDSLKQKARLEVAKKILLKDDNCKTEFEKIDWLINMAIDKTLRVVFLWAEKKEKEAEEESITYDNNGQSDRALFEEGKLEVLRELKQKTKE